MPPFVTKTRRSAGLPATSGTGFSRDCTACVRYAVVTRATASPQSETRLSSISRNHVWVSTSRAAQSRVPDSSREARSRSRNARGNGPDSAALPERLSVRSFPSAPSSDGTDPLRRFDARLSVTRFASRPSSGGTRPVSPLVERFSSSRSASRPSSGGTRPVNALVERSSFSRSASCPSSGGTGPVSPFLPR